MGGNKKSLTLMRPFAPGFIIPWSLQRKIGREQERARAIVFPLADDCQLRTDKLRSASLHGIRPSSAIHCCAGNVSQFHELFPFFIAVMGTLFHSLRTHLASVSVQCKKIYK